MTKKKTHTAGVHSSYAERWAWTFVLSICIAAVYMLMREMQLISYSVTTNAVTSLVSIVMIGVVASVSTCMALVGGLLLSVSAVWAKHAASLSRWKRFDPLLHFNVGRLLGYTLFGGLTGLLGRELMLSVTATGLLKIVLAAILILLGLRILQLVPKRYCSIPLPQSFMRRLHRLASSDHVLAPSILGALTYFIPCGFTQSMQLLALSSGDFAKGATIMFFFALGTLPALLGISVLSSNVQGKTARGFFFFTGALSLMLGLQSLQSGLLLTGIDLSKALPFHQTLMMQIDPNVSIDKNGQQVIDVTINDRGYSTTSFVIQANTPTWILARAPYGVSGCLNFLVIPSMNISKQIAQGDNWIGPLTPTQDFSFLCSQGIYKADVFVR